LYKVYIFLPLVACRGVPLNAAPFPVEAGAGRRSSPDFCEFQQWSNFDFGILLVEGKIEKIQSHFIKVASGCKSSHGKCLPTYNGSEGRERR